MFENIQNMIQMVNHMSMFFIAGYRFGQILTRSPWPDLDVVDVVARSRSRTLSRCRHLNTTGPGSAGSPADFAYLMVI